MRALLRKVMSASRQRVRDHFLVRYRFAVQTESKEFWHQLVGSAAFNLILTSIFALVLWLVEIALILWAVEPTTGSSLLVLLLASWLGVISASVIFIVLRFVGRAHRFGRCADHPSNMPSAALFLGYLLLPRKNREPLLGDLEEGFEPSVRKLGRRRACFFVYWEIVWAAVALHWQRLLALIIATIRLG